MFLPIRYRGAQRGVDCVNLRVDGAHDLRVRAPVPTVLLHCDEVGVGAGFAQCDEELDVPTAVAYINKTQLDRYHANVAIGSGANVLAILGCRTVAACSA